MDAWLIAIIIILAAAFVIFAAQRVVLAHRRRAAAGREELVGRTAEVEVTLEPKGVVLVEGELWTAILEKGRLERGEEVIITRVDGLKLYVKKKEKGGK
jgi:membrane-bound serine protease (ClpP class)